VILAVALIALYAGHLQGVWRPTYVITATTALYLNVFVGVVQSFDKLPALKALAPTGSEPPFKVVQLVVLALFAGLGFLAVKRFHPPLETAA
jgi:magnesium-transporting ATPase (P-type)